MSAQPQTLAGLRQQSNSVTTAPKKKSMKDIAELPKNRQFPAMLDMLQSEVARALPGHLSADRMARIALTCFRTTPKLAECEPASVFAAVLQAAQLGLEPGLLGHCYLIPYAGQCQLQIGYQGLVDLARRSGMIVSLEAHAVFVNDVFRAHYGLNPVLVHEPNWDGDRGEFRLAYAIAHLKDGGTHVEIMSKSEIDAIRDRSQNVISAKRYGKKTPWDTDYVQMAIKTVLRRITKMLPKSVELATAVALDDASNRARGQQLNIDDAIEGTWAHVEPEPGEGAGDDGDAQPASGQQQQTSSASEGAASAGAPPQSTAAAAPSEGARASRTKPGARPAAGQTTSALVE